MSNQSAEEKLWRVHGHMNILAKVTVWASSEEEALEAAEAGDWESEPEYDDIEFEAAEAYPQEEGE